MCYVMFEVIRSWSVREEDLPELDWIQSYQASIPESVHTAQVASVDAEEAVDTCQGELLQPAEKATVFQDIEVTGTVRTKKDSVDNSSHKAEVG